VYLLDLFSPTRPAMDRGGSGNDAGDDGAADSRGGGSKAARFVCLFVCVCVCVCSRASVFVSKVLVINRAILSGGTGKMEATTKTNKTTTTTKLPIRAAADPRQPGVSLVCECV